MNTGEIASRVFRTGAAAAGCAETIAVMAASPAQAISPATAPAKKLRSLRVITTLLGRSDALLRTVAGVSRRPGLMVTFAQDLTTKEASWELKRMSSVAVPTMTPDRNATQG
jgi:hypothetical protein